MRSSIIAAVAIVAIAVAVGSGLAARREPVRASSVTLDVARAAGAAVEAGALTSEEAARIVSAAAHGL